MKLAVENLLLLLLLTIMPDKNRLDFYRINLYYPGVNCIHDFDNTKLYGYNTIYNTCDQCICKIIFGRLE